MGGFLPSQASRTMLLETAYFYFKEILGRAIYFLEGLLSGFGHCLHDGGSAGVGFSVRRQGREECDGTRLILGTFAYEYSRLSCYRRTHWLLW